MAVYKKTKEMKENIKSTAKAMFSSAGYDNVKVEDIAKELDIAKGLIFYHFTSKDNLLSEIVKDDAKTMFTGFMEFAKSMPPDVALLQLFQGMFASTQPMNIADGFFDGELPEKYHYAVDNARLETVIPVLYSLISDGCEQGLLKVDEVEISYKIISMGFNSFLNNYFQLFEDREYHKRFLKSAAYILNTTLNPTRIKFEFTLDENKERI
ncbi:MAG: TetR/AcrR family transcriptional regulator [Eubacteriales bacterium]